MKGTSRARGIAAMAAVGLACLFAGIWIMDSSLACVLSLPNTYAIARIVTIFDYAAFFGIVALVHRRRARGVAPSDAASRDRGLRILLLSGVGCLAASVLGAMLLGFLRAGLASHGLAGFLLVLGLVLAKLQAVPSSAAYAGLFVEVDGDALAGASIAGIAGAYVLDTAITAVSASCGLSVSGQMAVSCAFVLAGILIGAFILRTVAKEESDKADRPRAGAAGLREAFSGRLVVTMLISSLMLGFFRGGAVDGASCNLAFPSAMLAVVAALVVRRDAWGIQEMLRSGVAFVSAGVLLAPLISAAVPGSDVALEAVGMGFFEATTWLLAVRCVRLSRWMTGAAAGARLLATLGHSLGAALAAGATMLASFGISMQAASLLLVFVYVMAAMFFFRDPNHFMNMAPLPDVVRRNDEAEEDSAGLVLGSVAERKVAAREPAPPCSPSAEDATQASLEAMEDTFYREPCRILAEEHGLTPRELDVLRYLAQDKTLGQIAEGLVLSRNTVKMHTKHVYQKLEVHSKQEAIALVNEARARSGA